MLLSEKTVLITGASRGIGRASAVLFAENGANLILIARNLELLDALKAELSQRFPAVSVQVFATDIRDEERLKEIFDQLRREKTKLDVLLNNAGIMRDATLQTTTSETIREIYETNVFASIFMAQMASKLMIRNKKGSIINLSSIVGTNGNAGQTAYASSKSAIIGVTKSLAKELAAFGIRVNALAPGFIDTDMTRQMDARFYEKNIAAIAMKRIGQPEDIAKVALFLASDLSDYVTGQIIGVDGGFLI
jgi:3-oxoacyl-[acyl-carrier protein] reductase